MKRLYVHSPVYIRLLQIWGDYLRLLHILLPPVPPVPPAFTDTPFNRAISGLHNFPDFLAYLPDLRSHQPSSFYRFQPLSLCEPTLNLCFLLHVYEPQ